MLCWPPTFPWLCILFQPSRPSETKTINLHYKNIKSTRKISTFFLYDKELKPVLLIISSPIMAIFVQLLCLRILYYNLRLWKVHCLLGMLRVHCIFGNLFNYKHLIIFHGLMWITCLVEGFLWCRLKRQKTPKGLSV